MSKARLVITAVIVGKRPVSEVARTYEVARSWIYTLLARYRAEGDAAFEPRSRRPLTSPAAISAEAVGLHLLSAGRRDRHRDLRPGPGDHSRLALRVTAWNRVTGSIVLAEFRAAAALHGSPASTLTDNGMVFTTRLSGGRGGRNAFEHELRRLGIKQKNGKPNHPQTQGKAGRFQQTLKNWLAAQHPQPADLAQLQSLLDAFTRYNGTRRPHKSLPGRMTPATACAARPKAAPGDRAADTCDRVRTDKIGATGTVTLRHGGKLYHIGAGREHAGTEILLLVQDTHIRVIGAATGELLRELTLDPSRNYQPTGRPPGPKPTTP